MPATPAKMAATPVHNARRMGSGPIDFKKCKSELILIVNQSLPQNRDDAVFINYFYV